MKKRRRYFVSINKQTITKISIPDADEYEIYATHGEITELRRLLLAKDDSNFWFTIQNIVFDPLESAETEQLSDKENKNLKHIYQFVYHHGTAETKEKIESLEIMGARVVQKL